MSAPDFVIALDAFEFSDFEVPERISFGGSQALTKHILAGGLRIFDSMGRDDKPLTWSGKFLGDTALERARYLDFLRAEGKQHILTWHEFRYSVVISEFSADMERYYKLPYTITLEVIADLAQPVTSFPQSSIDDQMQSDNSDAQTLGFSIGDPTLSGLMGSLNTAIKAVSSFANATQAVISSVVMPLQAVQSQVTSLLASVSNTLQNVSTIGGLVPSNPFAARISKVNAEIAGAVESPELLNLQSITGRMNTNLSLIAGPVNSHTSTVSNTTLYQISASEYGDATEWGVIAAANGLVDPSITGVTKISIPNQHTLASGGILA